jgi:hypothetical protein
MNEFISKHQDRTLGTLSGFDRIRFRGTFRYLAVPKLLMTWLTLQNVLIKDFAKFAESLTLRLKGAIEQVAKRRVRDIEFLRSSRYSKEDLVAEIIRREGLTEGVVCVLSAVEPCRSVEVRRNPETKRLDLEAQPRKCLHWYVYFLDAVLGLCHVRIQSWLPFTVHVCVNGRDMLCRELTRQKIGFERRDNCLARVDDVAAAQKILDSQPWSPWSTWLDELVRSACPPLLEISGFQGRPHEYYWSADESEWATDVMFRSNEQLAELYPSLIHHGMTTFGSREVMRFLGKVRIPKSGGGDLRFNGEVNTKKWIRPEGVCIKHRLNRNSLKMYDKQGSVLRVETTINDTSDFGVYRATEKNPSGPKKWHKLRKGVVDLPRRAEVSQAANARYLTAIAAVDNHTPLEQVVDQLAQPVISKPSRSRTGSLATRTKSSRSRGLHPLTGLDSQLIAILLSGDFVLNGFRNRDIRERLFPTTTTANPTTDDDASACERRRQTSQVTRLLRLFRAHGLIRKIPRTHRYQLTANGQRILPTFPVARSATTKALHQIAA